jgi:exopolysaccharide biosynthesis polyprenyl glycosylphosphotransferase
MMVSMVSDSKQPEQSSKSLLSTDILRLGEDPYWLPLALLALADALVFAGSLWLAYPLRFHSPLAGFFPLKEGWYPPPFSTFFSFGLLAAFVGVITFERLGFYHKRIGADRKIHILRILAGVLTANLLLQVILSIADTSLSRGTRLIAFSLTVPLAALAHYTLKQAHSRMLQAGMGYQRTLLVCDRQDRLEEILQSLKREHGSEFQILGLLEDRTGGYLGTATAGNSHGIPIAGELGDLRWNLATGKYDTVLIYLSPTRVEDAREVAALCDLFGVAFFVEAALFEGILHSVPIGGGLLIPTLSLGETPLSGSAVVLKRAFDLVGSGLLILVWLPLWSLLAVLIVIESRGPVFYRQERVGLDGSSFHIFKLRSMSANAEVESGPVWAKEDDPRRTRIGAWMRRWNIDETPQFINVFRGEMSLVGPRPERPHFVNQFKGEIPRYLRRHLVKSGITGWAQVHGLRGDSSIDERTRYDMWYIENWTFMLDLKILGMTLFAWKNAY